MSPAKQASLAAVEKEIKQVEERLATLKYRRNEIVSPLCKIPLEIGGRILLAAQADQSSVSGGGYGTSELSFGWTGAVRTCRRLHEIALHTGALWSFIDYYRHRRSKISLCLSRCHGQHLYIYDRVDHNVLSRPEGDSEGFMNLICKARRVRIVGNDVHGPGPDSVTRQNKRTATLTRYFNAINQQAAHLRVLEVFNCSNWTPENPFRFSEELFPGGSPVQLTRLALQGMYFDDPPAFPMLQRLELINISIYASAHFKGLIDLLRKAPDILHLSFDNSQDGSRHLKITSLIQAVSELVVPLNPIRLSSLHSLQLRGNPCLCHCILLMLPDPSCSLTIDDTRDSALGCDEYRADLSDSMHSLENRMNTFLTRAAPADQGSSNAISLDVRRPTMVYINALVVEMKRHFSSPAASVSYPDLSTHFLYAPNEWYTADLAVRWANEIHFGTGKQPQTQNDALQIFTPLLMQATMDNLVINLYGLHFLDSEHPFVHEQNIVAEADPPTFTGDQSEQLQAARQQLEESLKRGAAVQPPLREAGISEITVDFMLRTRYQQLRKPVHTLNLIYDHCQHHSKSSPCLPSHEARERLAKKWMNAGWVTTVCWCSKDEEWTMGST